MAAQSIAASARAPSGPSHIVLESLHDEERATRRPATVAARFDLKSLFRGTQTRLTLFKEGFLSVRTEFGGVRRKELTLDLRYLDPRPSVSRVDAVRLAYAAGGAAVLAAVLVGLASFEVLPSAACLVTAFVLGLVAGIVAWRFLSQTGERAVFRTARGHAEVLELFGGIGEVATLRRIVPAIVAGIRAAAVPKANPEISLRDEIREHYRLAESGVISADDCSTCTQRILHQFG